jgi:hypothetical protein
MSTEGHTCIICLNGEREGHRYCEACVGSYLCQLCRERLNSGTYDVEGDPDDSDLEDEVWDAVPLANNGCCPTCRKALPDEPLEVAVCDGFPTHVLERLQREAGARDAGRAAALGAAANRAPPANAAPAPVVDSLSALVERGEDVRLFQFGKEWFTGVRVGRGNPASEMGVDFGNADAYFVATFHQRDRRPKMAVVFTEDYGKTRWLLDDGLWDRENPEKLITFDRRFAGLPRLVRLYRIWNWVLDNPQV